MKKQKKEDYASKISSSSSIVGMIEKVQNGLVTGWAYSPISDVTPVLFINGEAIQVHEWPLQREDVHEAIGITAATGFIFKIPHMSPEAHIQLYVLFENSLYLIDKKVSEDYVLESRPLDMISKALIVSKQADAVAITCWDGAHNPIGRAKVLYDIVTTHRPAVLFTYLFEEFGGSIWPPLHDSNITIVTIPWNDREVYHQLMSKMGIQFDTVWMCKPRWPTFLLSSQIASSNAQLIIDLDDNEEYFSLSKAASEKPYGLINLGLSQSFLDKVNSRTVASISLQQDFGGQMIRHARKKLLTQAKRKPWDKTQELNIGFIGTVRPHKNILAAARLIQVSNWKENGIFKLHVYGDVQPESLRNELVLHGALLKEFVASNDLKTELEQMDLLLTGFPSYNEESDSITQYQITSKIGDALSVNRPVLVPSGPSVKDLETTPGIFLFNEFNFTEKLIEAANFKDKITLPKEFTLNGAYSSFKKAELLASKSQKANSVFSNIHENVGQEEIVPKPSLLLVWKQHDAGLYGRRIDQIARSYKLNNPEHNVTVLELMHSTHIDSYKKHRNKPTSHARLVGDLAITKKLKGGLTDCNGIEYHSICFNSSDQLPEILLDFFAENTLLPTNTIVILFPIIEFWKKFSSLFTRYQVIVDIVDNQFSWASTKLKKAYALQYNILSRQADSVVFNSEVNRDFFVQKGIVTLEKSKIIHNWYSLPKNYDALCSARKKEDASPFFDIVYSGNMNDRVDWGLLESISNISEHIRIHLIGTADRAGGSFKKLLLQKNIIYYGARQESFVLSILYSANIAIMPHISDTISTYMNPLKLSMYKMDGIHTISTLVNGIQQDDKNITVCKTQQLFISAVQSFLDNWSSQKHNNNLTSKPKFSTRKSQHESSYLQLIKELRV